MDSRDAVLTTMGIIALIVCAVVGAKACVDDNANKRAMINQCIASHISHSPVECAEAMRAQR